MEFVWYFTWTRLILSYNDIITYLACLYLKEFPPIHIYISLNMCIEIIGYFLVIFSGSFTNWLDYITCLFVLYRISTNSHLCTTNYSIFHQFLIVSPDKSTSARSSTIVIFDLWNPHNEYFDAVKYLSCSGMRSYKK